MPTKKKRRPPHRLRRELETLAKSVEHLDDAGRLVLLLETWRRIRASTLADAIGAVSERLGVDHKPLGGRTHEQRQQRWMTALEQDDPAGLARLLDALLDVSCNPATERVRALARLEPDPRVSETISHVVRHPPFRGLFAREFWSAVFETLEAHADQRCLHALDAMDEIWVESFRPRMQPWIREQASAARERIRAICEELAQDLPDDLEVLLERALGASPHRRLSVQLDALLEEIVAEPDDDEPRLVFADLLLEAGDPRGEFITLQCHRRQNRSTQARAEELLLRHGQAWLGPLSAAILPGSAVWERGFLNACAAWARSLREAAQAMGHPGWGTVRRVTMAQEPRKGPAGSRPLDVVLHPALRNLRELEGLEPKEVRKICKLGRPLGITRLGLSWEQDAMRRMTRSLLESSALPSLAELLLVISEADEDALAWFRDLSADLDAVGRPIRRLDLELRRWRDPVWRLRLGPGDEGFAVLGVDALTERPPRRLLQHFARRAGLRLS